MADCQAGCTVKVKDIQGKEYSLKVANLEATTLGQFKITFQEQSGIPPNKQGLVFNKRRLDDADNESLSELQITDGSCLHIVVKSGWTMRINDYQNSRTLEVFLEGRVSDLGKSKKIVDIKEEICKLLPSEGTLELREIRLMKNSEELRDQLTLNECGIVDNDVIDMKKKLFPPWNIFVRGVHGKSYVFQTNPEETTVADLIKLYQEKIGMPINNEDGSFIFNGKQLEFHRTLEDYNITNHSTIHHFLRLRSCGNCNGCHHTH